MMGSSYEEATQPEQRIAGWAFDAGKPLPIPASFFGIVLGLGGLAGGWRVAHVVWDLPLGPGEVIFGLAAASWLVVVALYAWKWLCATDVAIEEARHPVHCCFIGLGGVSTLVMAQGTLPYSRTISIALFVAGSVFTLGFGVWRTGLLWQGRRPVEATTPVLLLPVVAGSFVTAATAGALGWHEWAALAFGAAFFSWLAIESVVLHRLYTAAELPAALRPTLGIQLAPPSVGALAYIAIGGSASGLVPLAMLGYALLQGLLLLRLWRWITEQPFAPSYWAVTFGATALPAALAKVSASSPTHLFSDLAFMLFAGSNLAVAVIAIRTVVLAMAWINAQRRAG